jgi:hypothetical protein
MFFISYIIIIKVRRLEGEHKKGFTFSIELRVNRVESPVGTTYVGILHQLKEDERAGLISTNLAGKIISANKTLVCCAYLSKIFVQVYAWMDKHTYIF